MKTNSMGYMTSFLVISTRGSCGYCNVMLYLRRKYSKIVTCSSTSFVWGFFQGILYSLAFSILKPLMFHTLFGTGHPLYRALTLTFLKDFSMRTCSRDGRREPLSCCGLRTLMIF